MEGAITPNPDVTIRESRGASLTNAANFSAAGYDNAITGIGR
jgi:hypothetical protein